MKKSRLILWFITIVFLSLGCQRITKVFKTENPRASYVKGIQKSPVADNPIVKQWLAESDSVLRNPGSVDVPLQTKIIYFNNEPRAWAWQFDLSEGRTIRAHASQQDTTHRVFMELFSVDNNETVLVQSTGDSLISYTLDKDQTLILRVQPELFVSGSATLTLTDNPSMQFPVQGGIHADIGSFWGDPRDGGSRRHKGVDIFADRGTPVVAAADGRVTRTGNQGLGGKQVWLRANGKSLYYAHLDSINGEMLEKVQKGDTLGFVGNTGNARTTPPHLHFGIYDRGAINPLPFIDFAHTNTEPITADPSSFPKWGRISAPKANVRPLPSTEKEPFLSLTRHNPVKVIGGRDEWYQIKLPGGRKGFIYQSLLEPPTSQTGARTLAASDSIFSSFSNSTPFLQPDSSATVKIFGSYQNRQLAKFQNHWVWVEK